MLINNHITVNMYINMNTNANINIDIKMVFIPTTILTIIWITIRIQYYNGMYMNTNINIIPEPSVSGCMISVRAPLLPPLLLPSPPLPSSPLSLIPRALLYFDFVCLRSSVNE